MSLYWPLLRRNALFFSLAGHDATPAQAVGWYSVFLLMVAAVVFVCLWRRNAGRRRLLPGLAAVFAAQSCFKIAETLGHPSGAVAQLLAFGGVATFAVVLVALTWLWASACVALQGRQAAVVAIASFALSFFVKELWAIPGAVGTVLASVTPLASLGLWWAASRCVSLVTAQRTEDPLAPFPRAMVAIMAVFLVAGGIVRGVFYNTLTGSSVGSNVPQDALTLVFAGVLLLAFLLRPGSPRLVRAAWSAGALLVFAGLLLMVAFDGQRIAVGGQLVVVGRTCLGLLFWIMLADLVRSAGRSLMVVFGGVFLLVEVLSSFFGYIAVPEAMGMLDAATTNAVTLLLSAIAFVLIAATMVFFNRGRLEPMPAGAVPAADSPASAASGGASAPLPGERFALAGLTEREAEVAVLLAEGNSQKKISELLNVSIGTVQSHIKAIYRKCDVHSRQEFIDSLRG